MKKKKQEEQARKTKKQLKDGRGAEGGLPEHNPFTFKRLSNPIQLNSNRFPPMQSNPTWFSFHTCPPHHNRDAFAMIVLIDQE